MERGELPTDPEDRIPAIPLVPFEEDGARRWEIPVTVKGAYGCLVIREFEVPRLRNRKVYFEEASCRGRAVLLLDAQRRPKGR